MMPRENVDYDKPFITSWTMRTGSYRSAYRRKFEKTRHHAPARQMFLNHLCDRILDKLPSRGCGTLGLRFDAAHKLLNADWKRRREKAHRMNDDPDLIEACELRGKLRRFQHDKVVAHRLNQLREAIRNYRRGCRTVGYLRTGENIWAKDLRQQVYVAARVVARMEQNGKEL